MLARATLARRKGAIACNRETMQGPAPPDGPGELMHDPMWGLPAAANSINHSLPSESSHWLCSPRCEPAVEQTLKRREQIGNVRGNEDFCKPVSKGPNNQLGFPQTSPRRDGTIQSPALKCRETKATSQTPL